MGKYLKDPISALTHFIGAILSIIALVALILKSVNPVDPWKIVSFSIFGTGLFLLFTASTLYHWIPASSRAESILKRLDHSMVFVLIAASYTPICLIPLRGAWGWTIFSIIWGLAIFGILWKLFQLNFPNWLSTAYYLAMGWLIIVAIKPLILHIPKDALIWLFIGGIFYSAGVVFFTLDRQESPRKGFGFHEVWHLLVLAGSFSHFWVMYKYIAIIN